MAVPGKKAPKQLSSFLGSEEDLKVYCQPCDRDGPRIQAHGYCTNCAEHLCESCFTVHRIHTLSRHHTLLDKANMSKTMSTVTPSQSDNLSKPCPKHNIEMIKFYCQDHKALICSVCVTLEHTPITCKVNYIPNVSSEVVNSEEYQGISKAISDMTNEVSKTLQDIKKMNDASNKSLAYALNDIKKFRTNINKRLDELEKQIKEAANVILEENSGNMTRIEKECRDLSDSLKASSDALTHNNTSKQANDLFMELKQTEQMLKDYKKRVAKLSSFDVKEFKFEQNEAITNVLSKENSMGTLKSVRHLKSRKLSHGDKICIKTSNDSAKCLIRGMIFLTPDILVITDFNNMAVKMIHVSKKSVLDQQKLDSYPCDVASVSQDDITVTMPSKHTIKFMSVSGNKLKKKQTIKVDGECRGISCHKDKMVVSFTDPGKVQILLTSGTLLQTIQDENIFQWPRFVISDKYIYVSDLDMKTISKLDWQGEVKGKYVCRDQPYGLTKSDDGTLLVCFYNDNTIREISEDFTTEQTIVEDIQAPWDACWSAETCTLYTSSCSCYKKENDKFIQIIQFLR